MQTSSSILKEKALGRLASIGSFYDAETNNFDTLLIFNEPEAPREFISSNNAATTKYEYDETHSFSSKLNKFGIEGHLKIKALCGFELKGAAKYVSEESKNESDEKYSVIVKYQTRQDALNLNIFNGTNYQRRDKLAMDCFAKNTHLVTGITYGAEVVVTLSIKSDRNNNNCNVEGSLRLMAERLKISAEANVAGVLNSIDSEIRKSISFTVYSDGHNLVPDSNDLKSLIEMMRDLPKRINLQDVKPIEYHLTPLQTVVEILQLQHNTVIKQLRYDLDETMIQRVEELFDHFLIKKNEFKEFKKRTAAWRSCIKQEVYDKLVSTVERNLNRLETELKTKILIKTKEIKESQQLDNSLIEELNKIIDSFEQQTHRLLEENRDEKRRLNSKFDLYATLENTGIKVLGKDEYVATQPKGREKDSYVFVFNIKDLQRHEANQNETLFRKIAEERKDTALIYYADVELHKDLINGYKEPTIIYFDKGVKKGFQVFPSGARYEGDWKDDKRNGRGTFYWANGNRYEGDWKDDKSNGRGTYYWAYGDRYEGEFKDDKSNGRGTYYWANGYRYEGDWKDDKRNGRGTLYCADGDRYEGEFKDDKFNGRGTYYWASGVRYEGDWKDDKRNGHGTLIKTNGDRISQNWNMGNQL